jgi:cell division septum initiation protein DivIVA
MLEEEYIAILRNNVKVRKDIEHGTKKELSGKELDQLLNDADKYLKRIKKLFEQIQVMKEEESVIKIYDTTSTVVRDALNMEGKKIVEEEKLIKHFEDVLITCGKVPSKYLRTLNDILKAKKDYENKALTKAEIDNVKKEANEFIRFMVEYIQRKRGRELERAKIRVKYGNDKYGEVILLDEVAFIISDVDSEEKDISKAKISMEGKLYDIQKSSIEEFEGVLAKVTIPPKVFIKEPIFEDLRGLFGRDVEILVNY